MKKIILALTLALTVSSLVAQTKTTPVVSDSKFQQDIKAIKSMVGCYKVSFDFGETFSPDTAYKYSERYSEWGIEYVFLVEETDKKIALQHLLVVGDSMIVKHWRQDWVFENTELLSFYKDGEWKKVKLTAEQVKGTWAQKVYQVDDSPRYEGYGTWVHVDGRHFWESTADAPLPRREFTKRSDYNVMKRHSHVEINTDGWVLEQDNEKILRKDGVDKLLCWEKGIEKFTKGNYNCQPAIDWWEKNNKYWSDVRKVWNDVFAKSGSLKIQKKVEDKFLFEKLFKMGEDYTKLPTYNSTEAIPTIKSAIEKYVTKN